MFKRIMMANLNTFSIVSQNTTGWSEAKAMTLKTVMSSHNASIGCLQEHFQLSNNLYKISNEFEDYCTFSIPATKKNSSIHRGRPSGGLSMIYSKKIQRYVTHITVPNSSRVQALKVSFPQSTYIFINVYFPSDPQRVNFDDEHLLNTLQDLRFIFNNYEENENFVILGDINTDFNRNTRFVNIVRDFLDEYDMVTVWNKFECDFTNIQPLRNAQFAYSTLDHFLVKTQFLANCVDSSVLHLGENLSNHEIIFLKINCSHNSPNIIDESTPNDNMPNWNKATASDIYMFKETLLEGLASVNLPDAALCCRDIQCEDEQHIEQLDTFTFNLLSTMQNSVDSTIPKTQNGRKSTKLPGWKEVMKPLRDQVNLWKFLWMESGKAMNTQVYFVYRRVRHKYHYTIRQLKKHKQDLKNDAFLKAASAGQFNDILKSLKIQRNGKAMNSHIVDGFTGEEEISQHFSTIYEDIYNHHNQVDFISVSNDVNEKVSELDKVWLDKITPECIVKLIAKLKLGKNDVHFDMKTNAFIHGKNLIAEYISKLFKAFLIHGHFPNIFLFCSLIPIVKNNTKSKSDSDNYRLIAISSVLLKLLDLLVLDLFPSHLEVDSLQFGFQAHSSTNMCTFMLKETINNFINNGSAVFLCLLDLRKAFDHIKLDLLFHKLKLRLPGIFVRLILYTYLIQKCYVKYGKAFSDSFSISNGLRQGAIASPTFFNLYIDELFQKMRRSGIGCHIDNCYLGILGYADDLSLIAPSREGLQSMINIVREFFDDHGIEISTDINVEKSKTKVIVFNYKNQVSNLRLYDRDLPTVQKWEHLGNTILNSESATYDVTRSRGKFIGDIHALKQEVGVINSHLFLKLVQTYFCAFYGSPLWDLNSKAARSLYATFNYMIRDTLGLPFGTHRYILTALGRLQPLQSNLESRFRRFCDHLLNSKRREVIMLYHKQKFDCRSTFGRNYRDIILHNQNSNLPYEVPMNCEWKINLIKELMEVRNNNLSIEIFQIPEVETILIELCCG